MSDRVAVPPEIADLDGDHPRRRLWEARKQVAIISDDHAPERSSERSDAEFVIQKIDDLADCMGLGETEP